MTTKVLYGATSTGAYVVNADRVAEALQMATSDEFGSLLYNNYDDAVAGDKHYNRSIGRQDDERLLKITVTVEVEDV